MKHYVIFVHGIGEQRRGESEQFRLRILNAFQAEARRQGKKTPASNDLVWEEAFWADVTQPDQVALKTGTGLEGVLRGFLVSHLGDAVAYSKLPFPPDKYSAIQARFAQAVRKLSDLVPEPETPAPLTMIAHSLGAVIASDGIYDLNKAGAFPDNLALQHFFTLGSPVALYGLRYGLENFNKPIRPKRWINFYYPQDPIGYPLRWINKAYHEAVEQDARLTPGGGMNWVDQISRPVLGRLPPSLVGIAAHGWYFTDARVVDSVAKALAAQWA